MYTQKVDIWAAGCIFWELVTGTRAFKSDWEVMEHTILGKTCPLPRNKFPYRNSDQFIMSIINVTLRTDWTSRATSTRLTQLVQDFAWNNLSPSPSWQPSSDARIIELDENRLISAYLQHINNLCRRCLQRRFGRIPSSKAVRFAILLHQCSLTDDDARYNLYLRAHHYHFLQKAVEENSYGEVAYACLIARNSFNFSEFHERINNVKGFLLSFQMLSLSSALSDEETISMGYILINIVRDLGLMIKFWNDPILPLQQLQELNKLADFTEVLFLKSIQPHKLGFYDLVHSEARALMLVFQLQLKLEWYLVKEGDLKYEEFEGILVDLKHIISIHQWVSIVSDGIKVSIDHSVKRILVAVLPQVEVPDM